MSRLYSLADNRGLLTPLNEGPLVAGGGGSDTAWDDQQGPVTAAIAGASQLTNDVYRDTPARILCFRHDQNDSVTFWYQFTHRWARNTVRPHIHLKPLADPVAQQNVRLSGIYAWTTHGLPLPALVGWTPFVLNVAINPGVVYDEVVASLGFVEPPVLARLESSWLVVQFQRDGTNPADTYTTAKDHATAQANLGLLGGDTHIMVEKLGTTTPIPEEL